MTWLYTWKAHQPLLIIPRVFCLICMISPSGYQSMPPNSHLIFSVLKQRTSHFAFFKYFWLATALKASRAFLITRRAAKQKSEGAKREMIGFIERRANNHLLLWSVERAQWWKVCQRCSVISRRRSIINCSAQRASKDSNLPQLPTHKNVNLLHNKMAAKDDKN